MTARLSSLQLPADNCQPVYYVKHRRAPLQKVDIPQSAARAWLLSFAAGAKSCLHQMTTANPSPTCGRTSSTFLPRVTCNCVGCAATLSLTASTTRCQFSVAQFLKCALTQKLLCSTLAPGMSCNLQQRRQQGATWSSAQLGCNMVINTPTNKAVQLPWMTVHQLLVVKPPTAAFVKSTSSSTSPLLHAVGHGSANVQAS